MERRNNGITLIALVITIIVLLILAGIVISLTIGENGVMRRAQESGVAYSEQEAREKLELVLLDMQADKVINSQYNQDEYLTSKIEENEMVVNGDIVFVDGWQFEIIRDVPQIGASLGKGEPNELIKINANQTVSSDYVKSIIKVEIEYGGELAYIKIAGEEVSVPEKQDGKYVIEKEVTENGIYSILVKDKEEKYQIASIKVSDLTEDMDIWTTADMELFRDRVNSGRTYEGRTARLMADIDLSTICGATIRSWEPIGLFKGTFNGNYHTVSNLYINSSLYMSTGLFSDIGDVGVIRNMTMEHVNITNNYNVSTSGSNTGAIAGYCNGTIENCGINSGNVSAEKTVAYTGSSLWPTLYVGGIVGTNNGKILNCYNKSTIAVNGPTSYSYNLAIAGGIVGCSGGVISNCYNTADISAKSNWLSVGGVIGDSITTLDIASVDNVYSIGNITTSGAKTEYYGGLTGRNGVRTSGVLGTELKNSYSTTTIAYSQYYWNGSDYVLSQDNRVPKESLKAYATILGEAYTDDVQDENGNYLNDGYPILKWQVGK